MKKMPEHVKKFKTFSELSEKDQKKAKRKDRLFSKSNGFKMEEYQNNNLLYKENGDLACMTVEERERWYEQ